MELNSWPFTFFEFENATCFLAKASETTELEYDAAARVAR